MSLNRLEAIQLVDFRRVVADFVHTVGRNVVRRGEFAASFGKCRA